MDDKGKQVAKPKSVPGSISWRCAEGVAHAWADDGKTLLAELVGARVVWISAYGIRVEGLEPIDLAGKRFRAQAWQLSF